MPIGSKQVAVLAGALYLDSSAVVKLYLPEPESASLNHVLEGRRDVYISDLAVTEIASSLSRRRRQGELNFEMAARLHATLLEHIEAGVYRRLDQVPAVHREAERLLLLLGEITLRAADALHLALALMAETRTMITYDKRLAKASEAAGLPAFP